MATLAALALLLIAIAVGGRGFYVWSHCGYDCYALFGLSATMAMLLGVVLVVLGTALLLTILLEQGK